MGCWLCSETSSAALVKLWRSNVSVPQGGPVIALQPWRWALGWLIKSEAIELEQLRWRGGEKVAVILWAVLLTQFALVSSPEETKQNKQKKPSTSKACIWVLEARPSPDLGVHFAVHYQRDWEIGGSDGWTAVPAAWIMGWTKWNQHQAESVEQCWPFSSGPSQFSCLRLHVTW